MPIDINLLKQLKIPFNLFKQIDLGNSTIDINPNKTILDIRNNIFGLSEPEGWNSFYDILQLGVQNITPASHTHIPSEIGLGNVNNTSDLDKPISNDTQVALNLKQDLSEKGNANGYASLDGTSKIPIGQLPIISHNSLANLNSDDHLQYHNDTRGDIRYYTKTQSDINYEPKNSNIQNHISSTSNPHAVTKTQVGLPNVPNIDATLRSNHTGTQLVSTISDFNSSVQTLINASHFNNYVIVKQKSDFPTPSGGIITLAANTVYTINGTINLGTDRLVCGGSTRIVGNSAILDSIIFSGTSVAMITCTNFNLSIANITLISSGTGSSIFNCTDTGTKNFIIQECVLANSVSLGIISGFDNALFDVLNILNNSTGFTVNNCNHLFVINLNCNASTTGTQFLINSGTFRVIVFRNNIFDVAIGNTGLNINIAGITVTGNGSLNGNVFIGAGSKTTGFTASNSNFVVRSNVGLDDFKAQASMLMTGNTTQTINVSGSTWTKIAGTTSISNNTRVDSPSSNRLRYIASETIKAKINVSLAAYYAPLQSARIAEIGIYKNGVLVSGSQNGFTIYSADEPCSTNTLVTLNQNDYIEIWFQKFGGLSSDDYTFSYLNVQLTEE